MSARKVIIGGPFPTAKDTAKLLGVSDRRLNELLRLRSSGRLSGTKKNSVAGDMEKTVRKVSSTKNKTHTNRHTASASRKRRARGQAAKALS
jgi:phage antirepressor YoqD-like protein